jgi:TRAP-type C4-dicarboxylate transport system permease small subunit
VSLLVITIFLNVLNIGGRYLFRAPVKFTYELTGLLMVFLICLGWPRTTEVKGHVSVDILTSRLPLGAKRVLECITLLMGLGAFIVMTWSAIATAMNFYRMGNATDLLHVPWGPVALLMALGACLVSIILLFQFIHALDRVVRGGT